MLLFVALGVPSDDWKISFSQYKIYKDGQLAVSNAGNICLVVPDEQEIFFFDANTHLIRRHKLDSDAPDGFRQIMSVGYVRNQNLYFVYDFGRKISYWNESGEFVSVFFMKPLIYKPQIVDNGRLVYVSDDLGTLNSTPSLRSFSFDDKSEVLLLKLNPLNQVNGYLHRRIPGPPVKMPWHHQFLLAYGKNFVISCFNGNREFTIFDAKTLSVKQTVTVSMPSVPVDKTLFRSTVKERTKLLGMVPNDLIIHESNVHYPVPLQILVDPEDRIFLYSKSFDGYLRVQYNAAGKRIGEKKEEAIPQFLTRAYHYYIRPSGISFAIKRARP